MMRLEPNLRIRDGFPQCGRRSRQIKGAEDEASNRVAPTNRKPILRHLVPNGGFNLLGFRSNFKPGSVRFETDCSQAHCRPLSSVEIYL
jgi:hypothetical protein